MKQHEYTLRVFEQVNSYPKTLEEADKNGTPIPIKMEKKFRKVSGRNIDECLLKAKQIVERALNRKVRNVSIGPAGIHVILMSRGKAK